MPQSPNETRPLDVASRDEEPPFELVRRESRLTLEDIEKRKRLLDLVLRERLAMLLMVLFLALNIMVAVVLWVTLSFDHELARQIIFDHRVAAAAGKPAPQLVYPTPVITGEVVMALIGGTVLQVGAAAVIVARYLFSREEQSSET